MRRSPSSVASARSGSRARNAGPSLFPQHADQPRGPGFQLVEQIGRYPVAGVHDDIRLRDLVPHLRGQVARAPRDVGIGNQQQPHTVILRYRCRALAGLAARFGARFAGIDRVIGTGRADIRAGVVAFSGARS